MRSIDSKKERKIDKDMEMLFKREKEKEHQFCETDTYVFPKSANGEREKTN